jgi:4-amino-4-deoxy-L-arabinose transferase-like glycosyltransferase
MPKRKVWWAVIALAAMSFTISQLVGNHFFANLSINNDEPVYVLQAELFTHGHVTLSASEHGDAFRPWMSGRNGGHLLLVVQPVLPAVMAFTDLVFGSTRIALGLIAAGAVIAIFCAARQLLRDEWLALLAAGVFALSPLVIVQSALYLSYVFAVLLASTVIVLAGRAMETRARRWIVLAGLAHGLLFFLRPIEGLMLGLILLVWMTVTLGAFRAAVRNALLMGVGALPVLAVCLAYNKATTGSPLKFPLWAIGGNDAFGFGDRTIAEGGQVIHFGPAESFLALRSNLRAFPHWLFGGLVSLPLIAWGVACLWRTNRRALLLLASIADFRRREF